MKDAREGDSGAGGAVGDPRLPLPVLRRILAAGAGAGGGTSGGAPRARAPAPPGGASDLIARMLAQEIIPRIVSDTERGGPRPDDHLRDRLLLVALRGRTQEARRLVAGCFGTGMRPATVMRELLTPVARSLGRAWEEDSCDFGTVTLAMATLEALLDDVAEQPAGLPERRTGGCALIATVPDEQHGFGARMVAESLMRSGWRVDNPVAPDRGALMRAAAGARYDIIGLSVGSERLTHGLAGLVADLRRASLAPGAAILIGGPAVLLDPGIGSRVGADEIAIDAEDAVAKAEARRHWPGRLP